MTYLLDLGDLAGERTVSDVNDGANLDGLGKSPVGASDPSVVTLDTVVSDDLECLAGLDLDGLVVDEEACADLRSLRVQHDRARLVRALLQSLSQVGNGPTVSLIDRRGALTRVRSSVRTERKG